MIHSNMRPPYSVNRRNHSLVVSFVCIIFNQIAEWFQNDACNNLKEKRQNTCGISVEYTISKCVESTLSYMMCSLFFKGWISELVNYQFDKSICYTVGTPANVHVTTCLWAQVAWNLFLECLINQRETLCQYPSRSFLWKPFMWQSLIFSDWPLHGLFKV